MNRRVRLGIDRLRSVDAVLFAEFGGLLIHPLAGLTCWSHSSWDSHAVIDLRGTCVGGDRKLKEQHCAQTKAGNILSARSTHAIILAHGRV